MNQTFRPPSSPRSAPARYPTPGLHPAPDPAASVPPGVLGLTPDDLAVIYVEASVEGVRFRPLRVSLDGDFVDRWPQGFFAERAEELF